MNLHSEHFDFTSHQQRLGVIIEYLLFQTQIVDRLVHDNFDDEERRDLIISLVKRMAEHVQSNSVDMLGPDDYQTPFFEKFNLRSTEYAELSFTDEGPSYPFMRHLGYEIQQIMGDEKENRWVIDQVMDKDGVEVYSQLKRLVKNLTT